MNQNIETKKREQLAQNIKATRIKRKLTQADLAQAANISIRTYIRIELGQQWPNLLDALAMCTALDVPVDTLMEKDPHQVLKIMSNKKFQSPITL